MTSFRNYDAQVFSRLDTPTMAHQKLVTVDGLQVIHGPLRDAVTKRDLLDRLSICLPHRHCDLKPDERLVHFGHVALPRSVPADVEEPHIRASRFVFLSDGIFPVEFSYMPDSANPHLETNLAAAILELYDIVQQNSLLGLVGVAIDALTGSEVTEGRANITLPVEVSRRGPNEDVDAVWKFSHSTTPAYTKCVTHPPADTVRCVTHPPADTVRCLTHPSADTVRCVAHPDTVRCETHSKALGHD